MNANAIKRHPQIIIMKPMPYDVPLGVEFRIILSARVVPLSIIEVFRLRIEPFFSKAPHL